ncbi:unnamed protein product [Closterium sp. NIES-54]
MTCVRTVPDSIQSTASYPEILLEILISISKALTLLIVVIAMVVERLLKAIPWGVIPDLQVEERLVPLGSAADLTNGEALSSPERMDAGCDDFCKQWSRSKRRIALFVEPSPFAYVCGYKTRFQNFIRHLRDMGDEVLVVTTHKGAPKEFLGAKVIPSLSFPCPWYTNVPLALGFSPRIVSEVAKFKPDIIHSTSPGIMCFGAMATAKMTHTPFMLSYHTHVPAYIPKYTFQGLVEPMWKVIRYLHRGADHAITTSHELAKELTAHNATAGGSRQMGVWPKAVDSHKFNPRFRDQETRKLLSGGEVDKPLIVHVGRLGAEKNLHLLKPMLDMIPGARLAFIGDGPHRGELEKLFAGTPTVFAGMKQGADLSRAFASGDIFITPSETETLGNVVLEAMASGVPVVAARAGGIPDIVNREGQNGFLFMPGDVDDAVGKLRQLVASRKTREAIAEAGLRDAEACDWRASTLTVRNEHYGRAVYSFIRKGRVNLRSRKPMAVAAPASVFPPGPRDLQ